MKEKNSKCSEGLGATASLRPGKCWVAYKQTLEKQPHFMAELEIYIEKWIAAFIQARN